MTERPFKILNLLLKVRLCLEDGNYIDTYHSSLRSIDRGVNRLEILYVLKTGWHEKSKDKFDRQFQTWNYAIRGKTPEQRELRIIVSFDIDGMLIITAISLNE